MPTLTKKGFEAFQEVYKLESSKRGSFKKELAEKEKPIRQSGLTNYSDVLYDWYQEKIKNISATLEANKGNAEIEQKCLGQAMAYSVYLNKAFESKRRIWNTSRRTPDDNRARGAQFEKLPSFKNIKNNTLHTQFGITQEMLEKMEEFSRPVNAKIYDTFISLDENGKLDRVFTEEEIKEQEAERIEEENRIKEAQEFAEQLKKDREARFNAKIAEDKKKVRENALREQRNDYEINLEQKAKFVTNTVNEGLNGEYQVDSYMIGQALVQSNNSKNAFNYYENRKLSILSKIEDFKRENITPHQDTYDLNMNSPKINEYYEEMRKAALDDNENFYNENGEHSFDKKFTNQSEQFNQLHFNNINCQKSIMTGKLALYASTKRALDNRGFFSKLFHPRRTKQENAKFLEIKNDIKATLKCDDSFFAKFDTVIKSPGADVQFDAYEVSFGKGKVNMEQEVSKKCEDFKNKQFQEELEKDTLEKSSSKSNVKKEIEPTIKNIEKSME